MLALAIEFIRDSPEERSRSRTDVPPQRTPVSRPIRGLSMQVQGGGTTVSVAIAEGSHPVPFRTRKLSPPAPMVLPWRRGGRVGRRRDIFAKSRPSGRLFAF